ncbi:MAG: YebC/PmpR family DNA-binding transcriptional regulator [Candidatus Pacebacteria bacterium]|nr:YebC/PmpR family DNA-binding transcriptional regulator [Candidatus Paceibacterota bacterium]
MSGHSHARTVKHQKELSAKKRSQMFSKVTRLISVAVKEAGANPETNSKLRIAIEQGKLCNMPKENVERAIKRAAGGEEGEENLEEILFEAYGPGGIAILIEGIVDNRNRALGEIKQILGQYGGKLVGEGSVKWLFERKGVIEIEKSKYEDKTKEDLEMLVIEAGAQDIYWHEDLLDVYTKPEELEIVRKNLEEKGIMASSVSLDWVAKEEIALENQEEKASCHKLFDALDENDFVQDIYSNLKE